MLRWLCIFTVKEIQRTKNCCDWNHSVRLSGYGESRLWWRGYDECKDGASCIKHCVM